MEAYGLRVEAQAGRRGDARLHRRHRQLRGPAARLAKDADLLLAEASFEEGRDHARGIHLTGLRAGQPPRTPAAGGCC